MEKIGFFIYINKPEISFCFNHDCREINKKACDKYYKLF